MATSRNKWYLGPGKTVAMKSEMKRVLFRSIFFLIIRKLLLLEVKTYFLKKKRG